MSLKSYSFILKRSFSLFLMVLLCSITLSAQTDKPQANTQFEQGSPRPKQTSLNRNPAALGISEKVQQKIKAMTNPPVNIALFAVDRRTAEEAGNSDVIMIISINKISGKVKMASIMRDTYVKIEGHGMDKINAAYALGGPQLAIKTINQNFDMDISDYMNVDFYSAARIVDALGGISVDLKTAELPVLNNYLDELAIYEKIPAVHVNAGGMQPLNGKQTVAYTRIRAVGRGDYERTDRQRKVLVSIFSKMKSSGQQALPAFASQVLPNLETSMQNFTLLGFAGSIMNAQSKVIDQARFPLDKESLGKTIDKIWYLTTDLKVTTKSLHNFIYATPPPVKAK